MSRSSFDTPRAPSRHSAVFQPSYDGSIASLPSSRGYSIQELWSNTAPAYRNRALSIRSKNTTSGTGNRKVGGFSFSSLRGTVQPELSKKLFRLIKSENNLISAYETAGRERISIATQLSEWGEHTNDDAISDISDKVGVVLSEIGELEDTYAHALDDSRGRLKTIRNTEKSVQPSRDGKAKIADEIQRLKLKEPQSTKLVVLEQELVRAEAENLVAEAQLSNVTRQKLKEAYEAEFAATIERAEKQIILAKHGRRLLSLLDDSPMIPGDSRSNYLHASQARQVLNDAEDDLKEWHPENIDYENHTIPVETEFPDLEGKGKDRDFVDASESVTNPGGTSDHGHGVVAPAVEDEARSTAQASA